MVNFVQNGHVAAVAIGALFGNAGLAEFGLPIRPRFLVGRALFSYPRFHGVVFQCNQNFDYDGMERFIGGREVVGDALACASSIWLMNCGIPSDLS